MNLINIVLKGGILVYILFILSIIAVAVFIERYITIKRLRINTRAFMNKLKLLILNNDIDSAIAICESTNSPVSIVLKGIIKKRNLEYNEIKDFIETESQLQLFKLEKHMNILGTIAAASPLIGFLGTVTGMIKTFMAIQTNAGNVNPEILAGGIWEALVTTAVGLSIGIPVLIAYNYLVGKIDIFVFEIQQSSKEILELLKNQDVKNEIE